MPRANATKLWAANPATGPRLRYDARRSPREPNGLEQEVEEVVHPHEPVLQEQRGLEEGFEGDPQVGHDYREEVEQQADCVVIAVWAPFALSLTAALIVEFWRRQSTRRRGRGFRLGR